MARLPTPLAAAALASGIGLEPLATPKPGNTHRYRERPDIRLRDFVATSIAAASLLNSMMSEGEQGIGRYIYMLSSSPRMIHLGGNTSLGTAMMLAPLASALVASGMEIESMEKLCIHASRLASSAGVEDAIYFYRALRELRPSHLDPSYNRLPSVLDQGFEEQLRRRGIGLREILEEAAAWDPLARNILHGYFEALESYKMMRGWWRRPGWEKRVVEVYLTLLSARPDGLVYRKYGLEAAARVMRMASKALSLDGPWSPRGLRYIRLMDSSLWKRRINPGSTADIVATGISLVVLDSLASRLTDSEMTGEQA